MALFQALVITLIVCSTIPLSLAQYGSGCLTPNNEVGKCVPLRSCAGAFELLLNIYKNGEDRLKSEVAYLQASKCESSDDRIHICCPEENIRINPAVYEHLKNLNCGTSQTKKVSRGERVELFEYRWMAALKYDGDVPFACGGSLIDDRHVLTAAHCLHNFENLPVAVRLGEFDLNNETDCVKYGKRLKCLDPVQDIAIEKYIVHENYVYKSTLHDIAILRLAKPVNLNTKSVRPICLPISKQLQTEKPDDFFAAGWGKTEYGVRSNVLLYTSLPNRPLEFCEKSLGVTLSEEHICAGGKRFRDTCKGDSGGPLFATEFYVDGVARSIQYGVVSFGGSKCGEINVPAVYMNVQYYIQWITDHMQLEKDF